MEVRAPPSDDPFANGVRVRPPVLGSVASSSSALEEDKATAAAPPVALSTAPRPAPVVRAAPAPAPAPLPLPVARVPAILPPGPFLPESLPLTPLPMATHKPGQEQRAPVEEPPAKRSRAFTADYIRRIAHIKPAEFDATRLSAALDTMTPHLNLDDPKIRHAVFTAMTMCANLDPAKPDLVNWLLDLPDGN